MATVTILAERVTTAGINKYRGDVLKGTERDLRPLVDSGAAEWADGRPDALTVDETTWAWDVKQARVEIAEQADAPTLRAWHVGETRNPKYTPTGRKGVKDAIEERLGELRVEHPAEGLSRGPEA